MISEVEGISTDTFAGKAVLACRAKILNILSSSSSPLIAEFEIARFMLLHDKLAARGYVISEDNKEEMFVKILETSPELFDDLERFIVYRDRILRSAATFDKYIDIIEQLRVCDPNDKEHIINVVSDFLEI